MRNWPLIKVINVRYVLQIDMSTKTKQQTVSKQFYGLPAELDGPQRFPELGIKDNLFSSRYPKLRLHVMKIFMA